MVRRGALLLALTSSLWALPTPDDRFREVAEQFTEHYLRTNPEAATTLGDHRYDGRWTDYTPDGIRQAQEQQKELLARLDSLPVQGLSPQNQVDYDILHHHLEGQLWSLEELQEYRWNPLVYNAGPALYAIVARDYAPLTTRLESLAQRLERLPQLLQAASQQLDRPPLLHCQVALQQNQGNLSFLRKDLEPFLSQAPEMRARLEGPRQRAIQALEDYGKWLEHDLTRQARPEFRLGPELYRKKLFFTLESSLTPEQLAERAKSELSKTRQQMVSVARPLYEQWWGKPKSDDECCRRVLERLAENRPNSQNIVAMAEETLRTTTEFVREKRVVTLPPEPCRIIEMPEFNRGVAIAYCDSPGPLEKGGTTFYAIAPTPEDWTAERKESFYKEYNRYMLEDLTIHEAMPGHFLQLMHANRYQAPTRIRALLQSGSFVEGWATYTEEVMADLGYGGPEVRMQQLKMRLRLILNALLDQGVHLHGMTEEQAMKMLKEQGFQEDGEAAGKWRRACLTSAQLSTYFLGNCEVNDVARAYREKYPQATMLQLHDAMLSQGSPAPRHLFRLLQLTPIGRNP